MKTIPKTPTTAFTNDELRDVHMPELVAVLNNKASTFQNIVDAVKPFEKCSEKEFPTMHSLFEKLPRSFAFDAEVQVALALCCITGRFNVLLKRVLLESEPFWLRKSIYHGFCSINMSQDEFFGLNRLVFAENIISMAIVLNHFNFGIVYHKRDNNFIRAVLKRLAKEKEIGMFPLFAIAFKRGKNGVLCGEWQAHDVLPYHNLILEYWDETRDIEGTNAIVDLFRKSRYDKKLDFPIMPDTHKMYLHRVGTKVVAPQMSMYRRIFCTSKSPLLNIRELSERGATETDPETKRLITKLIKKTSDCDSLLESRIEPVRILAHLFSRSLVWLGMLYDMCMIQHLIANLCLMICVLFVGGKHEFGYGYELLCVKTILMTISVFVNSDIDFWSGVHVLIYIALHCAAVKIYPWTKKLWL
jgi:hypothetical protein